MVERILHHENKVVRHHWGTIVEHWLFALSSFVLLFSGFGQFPMYKRYGITALPGLEWSGNFIITLKIHYVAAFLFVAIVMYHLVYHGLLGHRGMMPKKGDIKGFVISVLAIFGMAEEPKFDKYMPEQRLSYVYFTGISTFVLIGTGMLKVYKNLPSVSSFSPATVTTLTTLHNIATFVFLFSLFFHLGAFVLKANRPLLKGMLYGKVDLEYVKERHPYWYGKLRSR